MHGFIFARFWANMRRVLDFFPPLPHQNVLHVFIKWVSSQFHATSINLNSIFKWKLCSCLNGWYNNTFKCFIFQELIIKRVSLMSALWATSASRNVCLFPSIWWPTMKTGKQSVFMNSHISSVTQLVFWQSSIYTI